MIDFKELLKQIPRFNRFAEIAPIIQAMEELLAKDINDRPDSESWQRSYTDAALSQNALLEMYDFISKEYVACGRTQMQVGFEHEHESGRDWFPAKITFSVSRTALSK